MKSTTGAMLLAALVMCQSCATARLWDDTNPNVRLWMDGKKITEAELQKRGVEYVVHKTPLGDGYLIEKSGSQRMKDYHLRMLGTPVTLVADAATTVVVVGVYMFCSDPEGTVSLIDGLCN